MVIAAIDLKSFYASVECVARGLDPMTANLVVADERRTDKTICLAVSPSMKKLGLPGRCRLFEVRQKVRAYERRTGKALEYIVAPPRMKHYIQTSTELYEKVYLKYVDARDIHVYSIDEVFIDLTHYLKLYGGDADAVVRGILRDIRTGFGLTATAGIGANLYLAKVAMDILAKHVEPDADGACVARLDERGYRERLWGHTPITDFWRVGRGTAARLEKLGLRTMGDVARFSLTDQPRLYEAFGVDAELLIDHAWGLESCTMADIHGYSPEASSVSSGQVLARGYAKADGEIILREMVDGLVYELVAADSVAAGVDLVVVYERPERGAAAGEKLEPDRYGRMNYKPAHGAQAFTDAFGVPCPTASARRISAAAVDVYGRVVDPGRQVRRLYVTFYDVRPRAQAEREAARQMDMFTDAEALEKEARRDEREARIQRAALKIREKYGRNALLRGISLDGRATARERNDQIGGHKA